ncbi:hypothetical protein PR003_g16980 [Phytophthora rubi]|uniref:Protein kinase domain-containing protein n=1 Tax=Phytophthora rubi TaxID=129364 RepID=A0A6A3L2V7_9STRA|nr:hypothetical protein PR001_g16283 [Phytophthora rubi]KAE9028962.1 hypothetical protein PR002_g10260 [Phytophthora rubi]KAE9323405.1 hypothetical protein PR003_g16980 [Phytophthora rubi]
MCIIQAVTGKRPWGNLDNMLVARRVQNGELPQKPPAFSNSEWELVLSMCKLKPSERLNILVVVQRLKEFASVPEAASIQQLPAKVWQSADTFVKAARQMLSEHEPESDRHWPREIFSLLLDRLEDLYDGQYQKELKNDLNGVMTMAGDWMERLKDQNSTVDSVKIIFRGFSLHRHIDRVLAKYFVRPSNGVHAWTAKCSELLGSVEGSKAF